jgi:hypothetical protein
VTTFQEFAAANLANFGYSVPADDIPDWETVRDTLYAITAWTDSVDDRTWGIIRGADISDGLWYEGFLEHWPGLYDLLKGNPSGTFIDTYQNVASCVRRAHEEFLDQPGGLAGGTGIEDVVGDTTTQ